MASKTTRMAVRAALAVVLALGTLAAGAGQALAEQSASALTVDDLVRKGSVSVACGPGGSLSGSTFLAWNGRVTKVRSSNKKVVQAQAQNAGAADELHLLAAKPGKATVSFRYRGKTRKLAVTCRKWANPVRRLTLGGKNYASRFKTSPMVSAGSFKGKKLKLKVTPASGWRLESISYCGLNAGGTGVKTKTLKNGATVPKGRSEYSVTIRLRHAKTGTEESLVIIS